MPAIELTHEIREAFATALTDRAPVLVASAGAGGVPDIAYKGSIMAWDDEHIAFWERAHGQTLRNLQENPHVCLLYSNFTTRSFWKFFGVATLYPAGELRDEIMAKTVEAELQRDPERKGIAVLIRVDRVIQAGKVTMEREPAPSA
jgi:hypothetical protein